MHGQGIHLLGKGVQKRGTNQWAEIKRKHFQKEFGM